ncbi:hypothetical protein AJ79_05682 [Helicocarpus griseus UAMH5409]|uniref:Peptidase M20 dimerisation domain-containing protein n=1 Tax=Helicocarpus griseus UAMH5409 TaxID=1447875 RepID=A0A2B7XKC8_9EURO|nr:hypothetical protein AJ79_05682 [Helicocarpus griseus UAMH5409]
MPTHATQDLSTLTPLLQNISASVFPPLASLAQDVHAHPELSKNEFHAHDTVVSHFNDKNNNQNHWHVTPAAFNEPTAWKLEFTHRPKDYQGDLPAIGFLAEYDALIGIGHACGHNLILLNGLAAADMARQAVIQLDIPARLVVVGTPDEEGTGGKYRLREAGAFKSCDVWMMAHPLTESVVAPLGGRRNGMVRAGGGKHEEAVRRAYAVMDAVVDVAERGLPGTASSAVPVLDVGTAASNIVATKVGVGVDGALRDIKETDEGFAKNTWDLSTNANGVDITFEGSGGHSSAGGKSALSLSIALFRSLSISHPNAGFYIPSNTSITQLDVEINIRSRYTKDMPALQSTISSTLSASQNIPPDSITWDLQYPAVEITPILPDLLTETMAKPEYGSQDDWKIVNTAPAATDASFVQQAVIDEETLELVSAEKVMFHPMFNICEPGRSCPSNHQPGFHEVAGSEFAYAQTEKMARGLAEIAVRLLRDEEGLMGRVREIIR